MHPILIDFGTWNLPLVGETHLFLASYGLIFAGVALAAYLIYVRLARASGIARDDAEVIAFWTLIAAIVGSKLTLVALDPAFYLEDPVRILGTVRAAGVLMGGVAVGLLTAAFVSRRRGVPFWKIADAVAVPLPLAQAVGRLGCLLAGCCYGRPAPDLAWAITFTDPMARQSGGTPLNVPLHPVQLYQFAADLVVFALVCLVWRRRRFAGQVMLCYLLFYPIERAIVEIWRGDALRGLFFGGRVSTSQILSAASILVVLALWPRLSARRDDPR